MALTLEFGSRNLIPPSPYLTIFSPSDSAFASFGQPPLSLLQLHFSPLSLSPFSLKFLPFGSKIPTLSPNHSLIVTSSQSDDQISLNGVKINDSAIFDDGSLRIFGIEKFFNPNYSVSDNEYGNKTHNPTVQCMASVRGSAMENDDAVKFLILQGYSVMASFLKLQLVGFTGQSLILTMFAPPDDILENYFGNFSEYSLIFLRHVVPCKISYQQLTDFDQGTMLPTFLKGFKINVTKSNNVLLNKVVLDVPTLYQSDWLYIHGVRSILSEKVSESSQFRSSVVNLKLLEVLVASSSLFLCIFGF